MKKGYIYITSSGYDPDKGKHVKDPHLGKTPTFGACMPQIRQRVEPGDSIFIVSGKVSGILQYILGGFEVSEKISAIEAYNKFPQHRLIRREDHQLTGNIIVDSKGEQHFLDNHKNFENRIENYIVGKNTIVLDQSEEVEACRKETMKFLNELFNKDGEKPRDVTGRCRRLDEQQIDRLKKWLLSLKIANKQKPRKMGAGQNSTRNLRMGVQPILF